MEGLISAPIRVNKVHSFCSKQHNLIRVPILAPRVAQRVLTSPAGVMKSQKSVSSVAASVQPLEAAETGRFNYTLPSKEVLDEWRNANAVCFDVDSTVCLDEGIDELAEYCGAGQAVAEWTARSSGVLFTDVHPQTLYCSGTELFAFEIDKYDNVVLKEIYRLKANKAMSGSVPFEKALAARLSLFNPSLSQVQDFLEKRPPRLSPGIDALVKKLKDKNKNVYLVSGGFRQMINPVASTLGIPLENIYANQLLFGSSGAFSGFDPNEPTSRSGGKATAVQQIRKAKGFKSLVMIGDGATDLEARKPGGADLFICYAGVVLRESVAAKADWLVFNFEYLINSLD